MFLKRTHYPQGILVALFFLFFSGIGAIGVDSPVYQQADQPIANRVSDLLSRMTLEEKVMQVQCLWQSKKSFLNEDGSFNSDSAAVALVNGIGHVGRPSEGTEGGGGKGRTPEENARFTNEIQRFLIENTRLGIPALFHEECLHGHAAAQGTSFSQPIGLASTWNPALVEELFTMTAREARARGTHQALTPVLDVCREPRWGRVEETYGEDPYLVGEIGLAAILGFQGREAQIGEDRVLATLKHMTGHGQPEGGNNIAPANFSERTIREVFLPPFKKAVQVGKVRSVMASYNEIDGVPSHANTWLIQDILRGEWGFQGSVVSDYYAVRELHDRHAVVEDWQAAAIKALETGIDIELPDPECYPMLKSAVETGAMKEAVLDTAVTRILRHKFELGLFDSPYVDPALAKTEVGSEANAALALKAAEETMILLKNEGNLAPLNLESLSDIAVIGPNADAVLLGGYSDIPPHYVTVLDGIKAKVGDNATVRYAKGCGITKPGSWYKDEVAPTNPEEDRAKIAEAVTVAEASDVVILVIGGNELTSREAWAESHLGDRTDLQMVGLQDELVEAMVATGKPVIVLLFNGRPLAVTKVKETVPTIFECWYMGQESGHAVANVLFGEVNPSGKLPISIPKSAGHIPAFYNHKPTARRGYLWEDASALWSFGYGLSYTTFEVGPPVLETPVISRFSTATVTVPVTNTGSVFGQEVVQLYIRDEISSITRPVKELKGFNKVSLEPGESKTISFTLTPEDLAFYDEHMRFLVEPGKFTLMVGTSSLEEDLQTVTLSVTE